DRGLHRGGNRAEEEDAAGELRGEEAGGRGLKEETEDGIEDEGADEDEEVEAPMREARQRRLAGEPRAVQEEEQADRSLGHVVEDPRRPPLGGKERRQKQRDQERDGEAIGDEA